MNTQTPKTQAIIVAGGVGARMNNELPKQFLRIHNIPIIIHTLRAFEAFNRQTEIIIVIHHAYKNVLQECLQEFSIQNKIIVVDGGETRFHSVQNGTKELFDDAMVFIHDAVRCMVSPALIEKCFFYAMQNNNAVPAINVKESLRIIENNDNKSIDRNKIKMIQTPQCFWGRDLVAAFYQNYEAFFTDEASVLQYAGHKINLIEGEEQNIKVTYPADIWLAEKFLKM